MGNRISTPEQVMKASALCHELKELQKDYLPDIKRGHLFISVEWINSRYNGVNSSRYSTTITDEEIRDWLKSRNEHRILQIEKQLHELGIDTNAN